MVVQRVTPDSPPRFKRFYVCCDALKRGWKAECRTILGLDGEMLSVAGRDGNNQMYPIAWAVVQGMFMVIGLVGRRESHVNMTSGILLKPQR